MFLRCQPDEQNQDGLHSGMKGRTLLVSVAEDSSVSPSDILGFFANVQSITMAGKSRSKKRADYKCFTSNEMLQRRMLVCSLHGWNLIRKKKKQKNNNNNI